MPSIWPCLPPLASSSKEQKEDAFVVWCLTTKLPFAETLSNVSSTSEADTVQALISLGFAIPVHLPPGRGFPRQGAGSVTRQSRPFFKSPVLPAPHMAFLGAPDTRLEEDYCVVKNSP